MIELTKENKKFGAFNIRQLQEKEQREEILGFISQNQFCVLLLDDMKHDPIIQAVLCGPYMHDGIAVIINGKGMENFKDTFHRSASYVDDKMVPYKNFKIVFTQFEEHEEIIKFFHDIVKNFGEIQIKGMKNIFLREKFRELA